jgi:hypothetical protein
MLSAEQDAVTVPQAEPGSLLERTIAFLEKGEKAP